MYKMIIMAKNININDPLEQFEIVRLTWQSFVCSHIITNFSIILALNTFIISVFFSFFFKENAYNIWLYIFKNIYEIVKSIIKNNTTLARYQYFSILFYLFTFILISNLAGLIPYSFTLTSSFIVTFFLASTHFIGINLIGVFQQKWKILNLFLPSGVPLVMAPFLILLELISYIARVFSLSISLFANMMSGHALLKILIGFAWILLNTGTVFIFLAPFPWIIVTIILFLETLIAFLQAYVFVILITIYINDVLNLH